jgi:uncharacterized protein
MMSRRYALILPLLLLLSSGLNAQNSATVKTPPPPKSAVTATALPGAASETAVPERKPLTRDPVLYSTSVELLSQSDSARNAAIAKALAQVVNQLTGRQDAGSNPVVRGAMANAPKWVQSSSSTGNPASDAEGNTLIGGAPVLKARLNVSFDPNPVDSLIAAAGFKYWTGERPKPLLWLSIDDGRGARLVTAKELNVIKSLTERGQQRGIRFQVPQGSPADLAALPAVTALNGPAVQAASARYRIDTLLIGKVYRSVSGWSAWWVLWQDGAELGRWPATKADARSVIASGADAVADFFAKRDASHLDAGRSGMVRMEITGIDTVEDYVRTISFLQTHAAVRGVDVEIATAGKLALRVDLRSGVNAFRGLMRSSNVLQPIGSSRITLPKPAGAEDGVPLPTETVERFQLKQ